MFGKEINKLLLHNAFFALLFLCHTISTFGQQTYKNYKIVWDSTSQTNFVVDTLKNKKVAISYIHPDYPNAHSFMPNGFIKVRVGDMRMLKDVSGKQILSPCHFIRYSQTNDMISAYVCSPSVWIFLNLKGDTISYGRSNENYCPILSDSSTAVYIVENNQLVWGFLDKNARWKIKPKFQEVKSFSNGVAKVRLNNKWGAINENGKFIVAPKYDTDDFKLE